MDWAQRSNWITRRIAPGRRGRWPWIAALTAALIAAGCTSGGDDGNEASDDSLTSASTVVEATDTVGSETDAAETDGGGESAELESYTADFESTPGEEWSIARTATTPNGDRSYLGDLGNERADLTLSELGPHDAVTVAFDLYILGAWQGGPGGRNRWAFDIDGYRVIETTFANDSAEQAFPDNLPFGRNPARSTATETDALGFAAGPGGVPADTVYRIERTFLHDQAELALTFSARGLVEPSVAAWGIDNVDVTTQTLPDRAPSVAVDLAIVDNAATVNGAVGSEADRLALRRSLEHHFGPRLEAVELTVTEAPSPLWLLGVTNVTSVLAPYQNLSVTIDEETASATGEVRTSRWRDDLTERLTTVLGPHIQTGVDLSVALDDALVSEVEGLRVEFPTGSSQLDAEDETVLAELIALLDQEERLIVRIDGHADSVGGDDFNRDLSRARAAAVMEYLLGNGVDRSRLVSSGLGTLAPEVDEVTDADRATNRRVVFTVPRG